MAEFSISSFGHVNVLRVQGTLQQPSIAELSDQIEAATFTTGVDALIVDCSELKQIGSCGMRVMCVAHKDLSHRGQQMVVAGLAGDVRETFAIGGVDELLDLSDSVDSALIRCTAKF